MREAEPPLGPYVHLPFGDAKCNVFQAFLLNHCYAEACQP